MILVAVIVITAACGPGDAGSGDGEVRAADLDGRQFWSASVSEGGVDRPLVDGTRIALRFDGGNIGASAGCNSIGGTYELQPNGVLVVAELVMTEIGCDAPRHRQDEFVIAVLTASPVVSLTGDVLSLTADDVVIELLDREVADPDHPILGTRWAVTGFVHGDVASLMAVAEAGWILFADDSTMTGYDGCTDFTAAVEVSDGSIGGPVEGDGEIQFGLREPGQGSAANCPVPRDYVDSFDEIFATSDVSFTIDGPNLTLLNRDGNGVTFMAAR